MAETLELRGGKANVMIVEDNPPIAKLMELAFEEVAPDITTHLVMSGDEAVEILLGEDEATFKPDLLLLDLDLPGIDGFAVLEALAESFQASRLPVVVISDHTNKANINRCYNLYANTFIPKPNEWAGFVEVATVITRYWFELAELPDSNQNDSSNPGVEVGSEEV